MAGLGQVGKFLLQIIEWLILKRKGLFFANKALAHLCIETFEKWKLTITGPNVFIWATNCIDYFIT